MKNGLWIAAAAVVLASACSPAPVAPVAEAAPVAPAEPTREEILAQGKYIVEGVGMCGDCHTPRLPTGMLDATKSLAGAPIMEQPPKELGIPFAKASIAIAGLPAGYTEAGLKKFMIDGTPEDGSPPLPPMPQYRLNDKDAAAVSAYLASLPKPAT